MEIQLTGSTFSELRRRLAADEYDLIITYNFELPGMRNVQFEKICNVNSGFLFSDRHPLAQKKALSYRDFADADFFELQDEESTGRDTELYVISSVLGLKNIRVKRCENIDSLLYQVAMGRGVTIVSDALEISSRPDFHHYLYPKVGTLPFLACVWKSSNANPAIPQLVEDIRRTAQKSGTA